MFVKQKRKNKTIFITSPVKRIARKIYGESQKWQNFSPTVESLQYVVLYHRLPMIVNWPEKYIKMWISSNYFAFAILVAANTLKEAAKNSCTKL